MTSSTVKLGGFEERSFFLSLLNTPPSISVDFRRFLEGKMRHILEPFFICYSCSPSGKQANLSACFQNRNSWKLVPVTGWATLPFFQQANKGDGVCFQKTSLLHWWICWRVDGSRWSSSFRQLTNSPERGAERSWPIFVIIRPALVHMRWHSPAGLFTQVCWVKKASSILF